MADNYDFELLSFPNSESINGIAGLAVGFSCNNGHHSAIFYESEPKGNEKEGDVKKLHFPGKVKCRPVRGVSDYQAYVWVSPNGLLPHQIRQLQGFCDLIDKNKKAITSNLKYGLGYSTDSKLDPEKLFFLAGPGSTGLTCSTFVLQLFLECGVHLVKFDEWPSRADDTSVHDTAIAQFGGNDESEISRLKCERGSPRCRPEEVLASCMFNSHPVSFSECEPVGKQVVGATLKYYKDTGIPVAGQEGFQPPESPSTSPPADQASGN